MLSVALEGLRDAMERHNCLRTTATPESLFIPTAECVYWTATIDEQLWQWDQYEDFLQQQPCGQLMPGVRYIRNLKTHQLPLTLSRINGLMYPVVYPKVYFEVTWRQLDDLPSPNKPNKRLALQQAAYRDFLAGRPTRHTLTELSGFFTLLESIPGTPLCKDPESP